MSDFSIMRNLGLMFSRPTFSFRFV